MNSTSSSKCCFNIGPYSLHIAHTPPSPKETNSNSKIKTVATTIDLSPNNQHSIQATLKNNLEKITQIASSSINTCLRKVSYLFKLTIFRMHINLTVSSEKKLDCAKTIQEKEAVLNELMNEYKWIDTNSWFYYKTSPQAYTRFEKLKDETEKNLKRTLTEEELVYLLEVCEHTVACENKPNAGKSSNEGQEESVLFDLIKKKDVFQEKEAAKDKSNGNADYRIGKKDIQGWGIFNFFVPASTKGRNILYGTETMNNIRKLKTIQRISEFASLALTVQACLYFIKSAGFPNIRAQIKKALAGENTELFGEVPNKNRYWPGHWISWQGMPHWVKASPYYLFLQNIHRAIPIAKTLVFLKTLASGLGISLIVNGLKSSVTNRLERSIKHSLDEKFINLRNQLIEAQKNGTLSGTDLETARINLKELLKAYKTSNTAYFDPLFGSKVLNLFATENEDDRESEILWNITFAKQRILDNQNLYGARIEKSEKENDLEIKTCKKSLADTAEKLAQGNFPAQQLLSGIKYKLTEIERKSSIAKKMKARLPLIAERSLRNTSTCTDAKTLELMKKQEDLHVHFYGFIDEKFINEAFTSSGNNEVKEEWSERTYRNIIKQMDKLEEKIQMQLKWQSQK